MNLTKLHNMIENVCPIHGVSIGEPIDKTTWLICFKDEATEEEKENALSVLDECDLTIINDLITYSPREFKNKFTIDEQNLIISSEDLNVKRIWFDLCTTSIVEIDNTDTVNGIIYLVSVGLITESRKEEILS